MHLRPFHIRATNCYQLVYKTVQLFFAVSVSFINLSCLSVHMILIIKCIPSADNISIKVHGHQLLCVFFSQVLPLISDYSLVSAERPLYVNRAYRKKHSLVSCSRDLWVTLLRPLPKLLYIEPICFVDLSVTDSICTVPEPIVARCWGLH